MKKWKLISSKPVFESKWMSIFDNSYKLPNGRIVENYLHLKRPDYVLIVAKDKNNNILLEKNYRRGVDDFVYELPAGWIDDKETPQKAALRELKEETGYVGNVKKIWEVYPQPAFSSMKAYVVYVEFDGEEVKEQNLEHDEDVNFELIQKESLRKLFKDGKIKDMGMLSALSLTNINI